ncbi:MAG: hypothetical protein ACYS47_20295, partial [Planctomycetota bacterium]
MNAGDPPTTDATPAPDDTRGDATPLGHLEHICFLVLGNRDMSVRAAKETLEKAGDEDDDTRTRTALSLAVRRAEMHGVTGREGSLSSPAEGGGRIGPSDADRVRGLFMELEPHSRALLLSHFAFGLSAEQTAEIVGIHPRSVPVNLVSLLGKLRDAAGTETLHDGCGAPESDAVDRRALGVADPEEREAAEQHLTGICAACAARAEAVEAERKALADLLQPLLVPDQKEPSLTEATSLLKKVDDKPPFNPAQYLNMSKGSCMGLMAAIGLGGAVLIVLVTLTPQERRQLNAYLFGGAASSTTAPPLSRTSPYQPPPSSPVRPSLKKTTPDEALAILAAGKGADFARAKSVLLRLGDRELGVFLALRAARPDRRKELDALLLELGRERNRKEERQARLSHRSLKVEANRLARIEMKRLPERVEALEREIMEATAAMERLRERGATLGEI